MERRNGGAGIVAVLVAAVMLVMLASDISAQRYTCWGGCFNNCLLRGSTNASETEEGIPCYFQCLNGCIPRSNDDYRYYCEVGCGLQRCATNGTFGKSLVIYINSLMVDSLLSFVNKMPC